MTATLLPIETTEDRKRKGVRLLIAEIIHRGCADYLELCRIGMLENFRITDLGNEIAQMPMTQRGKATDRCRIKPGEATREQLLKEQADRFGGGSLHELEQVLIFLRQDMPTLLGAAGIELDALSLLHGLAQKEARGETLDVRNTAATR
jgi:hypothetical protein